MTIVLTNDDGIDAPGLQALQQAVKHTRGEPDYLIVAPQTEQSGCGHRVTTCTPIPVEQRTPLAYGIGGTPADCVRLAKVQLCSELTWVLAGINRGGNMGVDIYLSGTVAAVREAAFHGIPAIAISQYRRRDQPLDWVRSQHLTAQVLDLLLTRPPQATCFWNVNLPHLDPQAPEPELVFCDCSTDPLPLAYDLTENQFQYCGVYAQRIQTEGTDVAVCLGGRLPSAKSQLRF